MPFSKVHDPAAETLDLKGVRVLLVEDSWHLGMALKNLLRVLGADVAGRRSHAILLSQAHQALLRGSARRHGLSVLYFPQDR